MKRDVMSVRLWLPRVEVLGVVVDAPERLVADARQMTVNAAARRHQVGWKLVNALVVAWARLVADHRRRQRCRVLLVEGTSIRKRHRYVTVLVNGDTGEVLAMVPHRDTQALSGFLAAQGHRWCRTA
ncbi:hypothetical protein [Candidatus Poriferisodalis sp.]|uniref:hypothetical protein n=1 Tax=Candidatus Poriferisodalis sp. TaxID=3101277 RepID=UPI003D10EB60